ncbi:ShlB/FhaC/HecB family hemolysin secretion/activation protein [Aphanothece sacrum]|uniref:Hemolysin activation/secretion protein n=1 Tax=Aphanothece sacrum FPU1 TaxID=1920663 RepID=A0A401IEZ3_APHSA|nr:ShlB/FhaC/HecB family hemolysin secretion/activation protein [Aphanothece sacrum]GBF79750.1 hemolysin activation/secretion protein [Aphanothece sacrum FPU1]GBF87016.1 hemolysin activation/secretion protein [Aphanothece sacrum FPU3]
MLRLLWHPLIIFSTVLTLIIYPLKGYANHDEFILTQTSASIQSGTNSGLETCPFSFKTHTFSSLDIFLFNLKVADQTVNLIITGNTVFPPAIFTNNEKIKAIEQQTIGKNLTIENLQEIYTNIVDIISQIYLDSGYITSQAINKNISLTANNEIVAINIIEGNLEKIELVGRGRLTLNYLCDRVALGISTPLNITEVEKHLRLLSINPLLESITANLKASGKPGLSILVVTVKEADTLQFRIGVDNLSPPSIGSDRSSVFLSYGNVTGWGDELSTAYYRSTTDGGNTVDTTYRLPLNPQEGTLQLRFIPTWTKVTQPELEAFDITGNKEVYDISFRQPLWRNLSEEFAVSLGLRHQNGQTFINGQLAPIENASSRSSIIQFGQDYLIRDESGFWSFRSQFNFGIDILDATIQSNPIPDGRFFMWLFQGQRVQRWDDNHLMIVQGELQLTPDPLLPDQWFIIGGGQSVRGYRQNIRFGDNGFRLSIEDRITLIRNETDKPILQIAPFMDMGAIWFALGERNLPPFKKFILGTGLGIIWNNVADIEGLSVRLDYGIPVIPLPNLGDNIQEQGFYFQVNYEL